MDVMFFGGLMRAVQGLAAAAPTLIVGLFIAALLRYYLGTSGTHRLFGGDSLRSLPQSWLVGMLLPVCSIGVIPIIREMRRMGVRPGAITAFALSAPLFNPLSLLYGLTLSRPYVIVGFALASLAVVTILGISWDRTTKWRTSEAAMDPGVIGLQRLWQSMLFMGRELCGATGGLTLLALLGLFVLGFVLPHGALQSAVEQLNPWAPLTMAAVSVPIYATPMLTMSQLGMMFAHGNSPGAAFCLLLLGTGVNLATLWWIATNYGTRSTVIWFSVLLIVVLGLAYAVNRPLIPPGVEPAGHTHAFDIYTNPLHAGASVTIESFVRKLSELVAVMDRIGLSVLFVLLLVGLTNRYLMGSESERLDAVPPSQPELAETGWNRRVSPSTVGITCLGGLVAFSVVGCYAFYPRPSEVLEEMRLARVELLSGAASRDYERVLRWIPIQEEWSRKLEVGYAMRRFELRPYQKMQTYLLRKKLELLEHATEHAAEASKELASPNPRDSRIDLEQELSEIDQFRHEISQCAQRISRTYK